MENLSLCSRILYDRDLLETKKKIRSLEYPKVILREDLDHFKNTFFEKVEKSIFKHVNSEKEHHLLYFGLSYKTVGKICSDISEYLNEIICNKKWCDDVSFQNIYCSITGFFYSFVESNVWEMMYEFLDTTTIAKMVYENIYWNIDHNIFSKILVFECIKCKVITDCVNENKICYTCFNFLQK